MSLKGLGWFFIIVALLCWAIVGKMPALSFLMVALLLCFGLDYALRKTGAEKG